MLAYKGFDKGLICRDYQFNPGLNVTEKANCAKNGFHCAENPLDCFNYYPNIKNSEYYIVDAGGDIDEDERDSKISCTHLTVLKRLTLKDLLLHSLAYINDHPFRANSSQVEKEIGKSRNGYVIVRGKYPVCHKEITFKSLGRFGYFVTQKYPSYILQRCKDGLMMREFHSHRVYHRGLPFAPQFDYYEIRRIVCNDAGMPLRAYFYGDYKHRAFRWIGCSLCGNQYYADNGRIYEKTLRKLSENELKCTALNEWYEYKGKLDPEVFLMQFKETPYIEKLIKAGFTELAEELLNGKSFNIRHRIDSSGSSLKKILCIDSVRLKELKETNGGFKYLSWLQYEKGQNVFLSRCLKKWFIGHNLMPNDLSFISDKMSAVQIFNYINKQMNALNMTCNEVMNLWKDYLAMAVKLNMDTSDAIIYRAGRLRQRHAELVNLLQRKDLHERANEIINSYPLLPDVFSYVKAKYEYAGEKYSVIAPSCVEDVLAEGRNLHHCVAEQDRYLDRIERRESYILFLRRTNEPDVSYYTLEVEPGGTIRQKRTLYDRNGEDIITAEPFLREWQKVIKERLSEEDKSLAETSKVLRLEEFAELDENNILIHGGELRGIRLVDVLMKDLLEAA